MPCRREVEIVFPSQPAPEGGGNSISSQHRREVEIVFPASQHRREVEIVFPASQHQRASPAKERAIITLDEAQA
jgi:hypothetical protein